MVIRVRLSRVFIYRLEEVYSGSYKKTKLQSQPKRLSHTCIQPNEDGPIFQQNNQSLVMVKLKYSYITI